MAENEFPSNSRTNRNKDLPERKVSKVVTGTVLRRKEDVFDKMGRAFFGGDAKSVGSYVLWDVLIPAFKNTISEMISSGIEMLLFDERRGSNTRRDKNRSYVSYNSIYSSRERDRGQQDYSRVRSTHRFDDIIISSRGEAEEVLSSLVDLIDSYDVATVADFYDLVGISSDFTDNKYGWKNLNHADIQRVREGWILNMPRPQPLD